MEKRSEIKRLKAEIKQLRANRDSLLKRVEEGEDEIRQLRIHRKEV